MKSGALETVGPMTVRAELSRRGLLLAAAGALAGCGADTTTPAALPGKRVVEGSFRSARMRGRQVGFAIVHPRGHRPGDHLPVVVSLHGRGASHATGLTLLHFDDALARVVADGVPAFAVATVDGGDHGYWHRRDNGTDAGAMVVHEFLPLLSDRGLDTGRLGLHGWSMGGYGALLLASKHEVAPQAVAVSSPALFTESGHTPPAAFDDAEDYAHNDVFGHPSRLRGVPLRVDCGRQDPFYDATRDFVARLPGRPVTAFGPGHHTPAYWRAMVEPAFRFLGRRVHD